MRELIGIADKVEDIARELGISSYSGFLEEANLKIKKIAAKDDFIIDIYSHGFAGAEAKKMVNQLLGNTIDGYAFLLKDETAGSVKIFEQIFSSVAIIVFDEIFNAAETIKEIFRQHQAQYKVCIVINCFGGDDKMAKDFIRQSGFRGKVHIVAVAEVEDKSIEEIIALAVPEKLVVDKLKKVTYLNSVKPVFSFLNEIIASENKLAATRKLLNTQSATISKKEEAGMNNTDIANVVKQSVQKILTEMDKSYRAKYDELNKPNIGRFSNVTKQLSDGIADFDKQVLAEKSEKVSITLNEDFKTKFVSNVRNAMQEECKRDENFIKSSFEDLLLKINGQLSSKGVQTMKLSDVYMPFPEYGRTLDSYCYLSKDYAGELTKKGATEYFVALRDYTGIIMVAVGILGPLNGIVALESEFNKGNKEGVPFFRYFNISIKALTAVITVFMIAYGIYDLRKRIPRKRVEEFERELGKARELINGEGKRIFSDCSRDWVTNVSAWVKEVSNNIMLQFEKNIKDMQISKMGQMNNEKMQQQKQQLSIDNMLKSISSADKMRDQLQMRFRDMVTETEKDLKL